MSKTSSKNKIVETANFIQHSLPGLESGDYLITAHNTLDGELLNHDQVKTTPLSYKFAVKGPRYSLSPNLVHSVFPPAGKVGTFETNIPHIVLTKKSLPWQRSPMKDPDLEGKFSYTGKDGKKYIYDENVPSWLAVLLFNQNDFNWAGSTIQFKNAIQTGTVQDLLPKSTDTFVSTLSLQGVTSEGHGLEVGEKLNDPILYIEIPIEVFNHVAPSTEDLKAMANVRQVEVKNKPTDSGTKVSVEQIPSKQEGVEDAEDMGVYSIVMGNRLPASGQAHKAVLVSLEGMNPYLPETTKKNGAKDFPSGTKTIRLPVLKNWSFNCQTEKYNFDTIFESLNNGTPGDEKLIQPQLKYYPSPDSTLNDDAKAALNFGYIPLNHRTRAFNAVGKKTVSWFRGPLAPREVSTGRVNPTDQGTMLIYHADNLLRQNPNTGLFDVSYAAAWQLGQLLALQDNSFASLLYQWKQQTIHNLIIEIDRYLMVQNTDSIPDLEDGASKDSLNADFYEGIIYLLKKSASAG